MSAVADLTRWNRAGMSRFTYIDGNAVTFLEQLRQCLIEMFSDPAAHTLQWENLVSQLGSSAWDNLQREIQQLQNETPLERNDRIATQYHGDRRDWAWELARALARSSQILTGHVDAYANEGFLGTATQWDNVRRLVEMIDYHPAPPASASTRLVVKAKKGATGVLNAGFGVSYQPPDGGEPVVFETLDDLAIDSALDGLRPVEAGYSRERFTGHTLLLEGEWDDLKTGEPLVLVEASGNVLRAHLIAGSRKLPGATEVQVVPRLSHRLRKGRTQVFVKPAERLVPTGPAAPSANLKQGMHLTGDPTGLAPGQVAWIGDGATTLYRWVAKVQTRLVVFDSPLVTLRLATAQIDHPVDLNIVAKESESTLGTTTAYSLRVVGDWSRLANSRVAIRPDDSGKGPLPTYLVQSAIPYPAEDTDALRRGHTVLNIVSDNNVPGYKLDTRHALLVPPVGGGRWHADSFLVKVSAKLPPSITTTKSKKATSGDLAVVVSGRQMAWARLASVSVDEDLQQSTITALDGWQDRGGGELFLAGTSVYAHFKGVCRTLGWQENRDPLTGNRIPLDAVPKALEKGRVVMVEKSDDPGAAIFTKVQAIEDTTLVLADPLPAGATRGNTLLSGNVVLAGHGESRMEKVLGSGDAGSVSQSFIFEETRVSFVADPKQPRGVRSAITIAVDGRTWEQVDSLASSGPSDAHYTVRMNEEGFLRITFGDGVHGRRLPTGVNNVRIAWRKGTGLAGNLHPGSLVKPVQPHRLVERVLQPLPSTGGNDMEDVESLRNNAPAALLTLERAVSLDDFAALAASQSSVWQARAFSRPTGLGRNNRVEVVVVPAGGGPLGILTSTLRRYLLEHSAPDTDVTVLPYRQETFALDVSLDVNPAEYSPDLVMAAVRSALLRVFSLRKRKLGQDLFLSEVYQVVESTPGVEHSVAVIDGDTSKRRVPAAEQAILVLGPLVVECTGSGAAPAAAPGQGASSPVRPIGKRGVSIVQGVGPAYTEALRRAGIRSLADLRGLDPRKPFTGIPLAKLWEFKTKADMIMGLAADPRRLSALLDRPIGALAAGSSVDIAKLTGQPPAVFDELKTKLHLLEVALADDAFGSITLGELLGESS